MMMVVGWMPRIAAAWTAAGGRVHRGPEPGLPPPWPAGWPASGPAAVLPMPGPAAAGRQRAKERQLSTTAPWVLWEWWVPQQQTGRRARTKQHQTPTHLSLGGPRAGRWRAGDTQRRQLLDDRLHQPQPGISKDQLPAAGTGAVGVWGGWEEVRCGKRAEQASQHQVLSASAQIESRQP